MRYGPITKQAYRLMHEGALELVQVELNGIRVDSKALTVSKGKVKDKMSEIEKALLLTPEGKEWKRWSQRTGKRIKLDNDHQTRHVLYSLSKHSGKSQTKGGLSSVNEKALMRINNSFTNLLLEWRKYEAVAGTFFPQIERETVNGWLRPFYSLNLARTFRSTSDSPNWQNQPSRDEIQMHLVRDLIYPRLGHQIGEDDYGGIEVCIAACYHKDPNMIKYICDPRLDMHRDTAADCYLLKSSQIGKKIRYCGKNGFVFPEFYGSYWADVGRSLWDMTKLHSLVTEDGIPLREHLADQGITKLGKVDERGKPEKGSFLAHIQAVEDKFWNVRFPVYTQWKKDWYKAYLKKGHFDTLTGFRCQGIMGRNDAINYPVQGSAFHCLLWSLTRMGQRLREQKFDTRIVGTIHDSILKDNNPDEVRAVVKMAKSIMLEEICNEWKWINIPLKAEFEIAPVDRPWSEKKEIKEVA